MGRRGQSISLSISERDKAQLESLALELGMTWGDRPNISKLVEAIARGKLSIAPNHDWTSERIQALNQARTALIDAGRTQDAVAIAQLLVERSEITIPLRMELEQFIQKPALPWRMELDQYIHRQQPFQLSYQDAAERVWQFTIRFAEIVTHEERRYLDCWCEETEGNRNISELSHNWCLRLDRITDAAISPISGSWRSSLDTIQIEMHLLRGLAFAYRSKTAQDEINEWLADSQQARRVVRRVSSTFWFIREVLRYGRDCEIILPEGVRDLIKREVQGLYNLYDMSEDSF